MLAGSLSSLQMGLLLQGPSDTSLLLLGRLVGGCSGRGRRSLWFGHVSLSALARGPRGVLVTGGLAEPVPWLRAPIFPLLPQSRIVKVKVGFLRFLDGRHWQCSGLLLAMAGELRDLG